MTITTIILLILLGLLIVLAEIFFVPGSTVVGLIGIVIVLIGIWAGFYYGGRTRGFIFLGGTVAAMIVLAYLGMRTKTWQKFEVKSFIGGKAAPAVAAVKVGDQGITLSRCTPIGKAQFGNMVEEVYSDGDFLDPNVTVVVKTIRENKIIVQQLKA
jgi:membrane-bound ClpP family serine protease